MVGSIGGNVVDRVASRILLALRLRYQTIATMTATASTALIDPPMIPVRVPPLNPPELGFTSVNFCANTWSVINVRPWSVGDVAGTTVVEGSE